MVSNQNSKVKDVILIMLRFFRYSTNIVIKRLILPISGKENGDMRLVPHFLIKAKKLCRVIKILHIDPE